MDCVVNDKHRYMMFYGAKAACTSLRTLYLAIHKNELEEGQLAQLDGYHNINEIQPFVPQKDYRGYFKFYLSRNPYSRVVSAYLDQYTFAKNTGVQKMLIDCPPTDKEPETFIELLRYLKNVPDDLRDAHFQTQAYFGHGDILPSRPWTRRMIPGEIALDYSGDIGKFNVHLKTVYQKIFKKTPELCKRALEEIKRVPNLNNLLYGEESWQDAAELSGDFIRTMAFLPKPQDFFTSSEPRELVQEIYAKDFSLFGYEATDVPCKGASPELKFIPEDFDWQIYALLNPDLAPLGVDNERRLTHHYLMHGRNETRTRFYKIEAPTGFDWKNYLKLNDDLRNDGVDNERDALIHYLSFGHHENRAI